MPVIRNLKYLFGRVASSPRLAPLFHRLVADRATVFMFHRFLDPEYGVEGHNPMILRKALAEFRRMGLKLVPLLEVIQRAREGRPIGGMVAFTVDDGYGDFHRVGGPLFASMDCPVTVFLPTGFLDRPSWLWWDRLRFILEAKDNGDLRLDLGTETFSGSFSDYHSRKTVRHQLASRLEEAPPEWRDQILARLEVDLEVEIPESLPKRFAPMTWDQVRESESNGVTFGAHTVSHRNLMTLPLAEAREEVSKSWNRVREETSAAVPVFCYPFGGGSALPPIPEPLFQDCGIQAAVTTIPGYLSEGTLKEAPFRIPRFPWEATLYPMRQVVSGFEEAKKLGLAKRKRSEFSPERR